MNEVSDRFSISRPAIKVLSRAGVEPSELFYEYYWKERDGWLYLDYYDYDNRGIASGCNLSSVSFAKKRSSVYASFSLDGKWLYNEETQKKCQLNIDQAIPQSLALAYVNRKLGEAFDGIEFLLEEKIEKSKMYETFTEFYLSVRWQRLIRAQIFPKKPRGIYLF